MKSLPAEPIKPIAANSHGTYIAGGGQSGDIYMWEVKSSVSFSFKCSVFPLMKFVMYYLWYRLQVVDY